MTTIKTSDVHFKFNVHTATGIAIYLPTGQEVEITEVNNYNTAKKELLLKLRNLIVIFLLFFCTPTQAQIYNLAVMQDSIGNRTEFHGVWKFVVKKEKEKECVYVYNNESKAYCNKIIGKQERIDPT